ncbi:hypothetical protein [Halobacterium sp. CBA1126]|uniref:hypothetical protein n=1 Tax=Halobacterium sp. CBA1126 TaxID=2668074 RepID=UPI0012FAA0D1|nr:hypothetical protein [Halobacterium sp. CBA1126]MUV60434.1 hypothetical protein [Halobacterium sp. CBA1126]
MDGRLARLWQVVVGVTLVSAAVVVVVASTDPSWPVPGMSTLAALAAVFAAGFALAAILRVLAGDHQHGVGHVLAVVGWLLLLVGELFESEAATVAGVAVVLAAGSYLVWLAVD